MPSLTAIGLRTALLSGTYTAGTFETALATASTAAAFTELVNTYGSAEILVNSTVALPVITGASTARTIAGNGPAFLRACANSSYATEQLVTTTNGAALFGPTRQHRRKIQPLARHFRQLHPHQIMGQCFRL